MSQIEPLMSLDVQTRLVASVSSAAPSGEHRVHDIVGGRFDGPRLRGQLPASGGDWSTRGAAGSQLDVRLLLQTDDGVSILMRYQGKASQREDGTMRIEVSGSFQAPGGDYDWLNAIQTFGLGTPTAQGVHYQFYRFT